ncbi:MAG: uridine kinase [Bacteroidetes bacterium]|nr:uridine kinase [Bacteroidota bacterium]
MQSSKPLRIAINGMEGAGKTVLASRLTNYLNAHQATAIHVSIDGYHHDRERRYRQGRDSARGYYDDAYDEDAFVRSVLLSSQLDPPVYTSAIHDLDSDQYLDLPATPLRSDSILITDGSYLFKPVYAPHWDLKIYLKADPAIAMERGVCRDSDALGGEAKAREKYQRRYHAAFAIYQREVNPEALADIVIDYNDFENPVLLK